MTAATAHLLKQGYRALLLFTDWASYLVLAMMAIVTSIDIFCRYFLGFSIQISEEVASLGLVALIFISLPGAFEDCAFLRVDALYKYARGRLKVALDFFFHLVSLAVTLVYLVYIAKLVANSFRTGVHADTSLGTPNYLPQSAMAFALCALLVAIVVGLTRLMRGRPEARDDIV